MGPPTIDPFSAVEKSASARKQYLCNGQKSLSRAVRAKEDLQRELYHMYEIQYTHVQTLLERLSMELLNCNSALADFANEDNTLQDHVASFNRFSWSQAAFGYAPVQSAQSLALYLNRAEEGRANLKIQDLPPKLMEELESEKAAAALAERQALEERDEIKYLLKRSEAEAREFEQKLSATRDCNPVKDGSAFSGTQDECGRLRQELTQAWEQNETSSRQFVAALLDIQQQFVKVQKQIEQDFKTVVKRKEVGSAPRLSVLTPVGSTSRIGVASSQQKDKEEEKKTLKKETSGTTAEDVSDERDQNNPLVQKASFESLQQTQSIVESSNAKEMMTSWPSSNENVSQEESQDVSASSRTVGPQDSARQLVFAHQHLCAQLLQNLQNVVGHFQMSE